MAFEVHRAERADLLVEGLARLLRDPLPDPFATELVLVPARGVERWLSQRLSHHLGHAPGREDGVCAGVEFRSPASLVAELLGTREDDPWAPEALMWPLLRVIDASVGQPWARVLGEHLGQGLSDEEGELRRGRRLAVARRLAGLFASYAVQRPAMVTDWESGGSGDGGGGRLPDDLAWQPPLWRGVLTEVALPSLVARHRAAVQALEQGAEIGLPDRISLFGHTRMSSTEAELLTALGVTRGVHLWLPHPSDALWRQLAKDERARYTGWRRDDHSHEAVEHPLLATMGRDVREGETTLLAAGAVDAGVLRSPDRSGTVLGEVQCAVAANRAPSRTARVDASVQVHACHGPARQVEVLREVLLGLLADDPSLEPRDIVVMCPDIDSYAPLISGAFGLGEAVAGAHPGQQLKVMLADRAPSQTNPLLGVLVRVLALADERAEATRVLDLLAMDPVRRRFGFSEADLETISTWVTTSGVRWAWDQEGRRRYGLEQFPQNTWRFGLDRVLTGVALSEDSAAWVGSALPLDDVSTTGISLTGRLAEAIDRLHDLTTRLSGTHEVEHWLELLRECVASLTVVPRGEDWQLNQVQRELASLGHDAGTGSAIELRLSDVSAMLHGQLGARPTRANFRTGTLTVATMTPMRSVPHRVVCLLGLDDGVFPRGSALDGDDVLARLPQVGERDRRSEDRQLFLDAIMSASERLVITYTGFNEATGQPRPPSVPLREFLDVVAATTTAQVVRQHHSQAFHPDYLVRAEGGLVPFSFDPDAARAARAAAGLRTPVPVLAHVCASSTPVSMGAPDQNTGDQDPGDLDLEDLIDALTSPVRAYLRRRLAIELPWEADEVLDSIPVQLGGLDRWQIGERLLAELLRGRPGDQVMQAEWRRGTLPPGRYGWRRMREIAESAVPLWDAFESSTQGIGARTRDIEVDLGAGRRLTGTVAGLYDQRLVRVGFSRLKAKQRLEVFVSLVALSAAAPGAWVARAIGRAEKGDALARATYSAITDPLSVLSELVALHDLAMSRVLPLTADTGRLWARTATSSAPPWSRRRDLAEPWRQDNRTAEIVTAWGRRPTWEQLTAEPGQNGGHLFGELATRLWTPVLAAEVE